MEQEIDLRRFFQVIRRRYRILLLSTAAAVAAGLILTCFVLTPLYRSTTTLIVISRKDTQNIDYNTILLNRQLVKTYGKIAQSRAVASAVANALNLSVPVEVLQRQIKVATLGDTEVIAIEAVDPDPNRAAAIANKVAEVFMVQATEIMNFENIKVIDPAISPDHPFKPRRLLNLAASLALGAMLGLGLVFILEYLDNTIKTADDLQQHLGLPLLGSIPVISPVFNRPEHPAISN